MDAVPIRSPQRLHTALARRFAGKRLVEIGTRNGDGMSCFARVTESAVAIELNSAYCHKLQRLASTKGLDLSVVCSDYRKAPLDADMVTWWEQYPLTNDEALATLRREQLAGRVRSSAHAVPVFDLSFEVDVKALRELCHLAAWLEEVPFDERALCEAHRTAGRMGRTKNEVCTRAQGVFVALGIPVSRVGSKAPQSEASGVCARLAPLLRARSECATLKSETDLKHGPGAPPLPVLAPWASSIYLYAVVSVQAHPLLPHWCTHYAAHGLNLSRTARVVLQSDGGADDTAATPAALIALSRCGIGHAEPQLTWLARQDFKKSAETHLINAVTRSLPQGSWLIRSDVDEHFHFPCTTTRALLHKSELSELAPRHGLGHPPYGLCAHLVERVASDMRLGPVPDPPMTLAERFPLCVPIRNAVQRADSVKVLLTRSSFSASVPNEWEGSHRIALRVPHKSGYAHEWLGSQAFVNCADAGLLSHYSFTTVNVPMVEKKIREPRWAQVYLEERSRLYDASTIAEGRQNWSFTQSMQEYMLAHQVRCPADGLL